MTIEHEEAQARTRSRWRRFLPTQALITSVFLIISLLSLLLAYLQWQGPEPAVTINTINETNVLDLRRTLDDLNVIFRGQDIEDQNLNLRILTINVANTGEIDILQSQYDSEDDWGMKFSSGEVIEARLVDTNAEHLSQKVIPQLLASDTVGLPRVILDKGDSFTLEVLVLHPKNELPIVSSIGKIAGIKEIYVTRIPLDRQEGSLLARLFPGGAVIQVARAFIYFIGSIAAIIGTILTIVGITKLFNTLKAWKRRKRILKTNAIRNMDQVELKDFLVRYYELRGTAGIKQLQEFIEDPNKISELNPMAGLPSHLPDQIDDRMHASRVFDVDMEMVIMKSPFPSHTLTVLGYLKREDGNAVIDPRFIEAVNSLLTDLIK